jgi:hypothetical protein
MNSNVEKIVENVENVRGNVYLKWYYCLKKKKLLDITVCTHIINLRKFNGRNLPMSTSMCPCPCPCPKGTVDMGRWTGTGTGTHGRGRGHGQIDIIYYSSTYCPIRHFDIRRFVPFDILSHSMLFLFDILSHSTLCPIRPLLLSTLCLFGVLSHSTFCLFDILSHSTFWHSAFCPIRCFVVRRFVHSAFVTSTFYRWTVPLTRNFPCFIPNKMRHQLHTLDCCVHKNMSRVNIAA